jgi:hypothetical protein
MVEVVQMVATAVLESVVTPMLVAATASGPMVLVVQPRAATVAMPPATRLAATPLVATRLVAVPSAAAQLVAIAASVGRQSVAMALVEMPAVTRLAVRSPVAMRPVERSLAVA